MNQPSLRSSAPALLSTTTSSTRRSVPDLQRYRVRCGPRHAVGYSTGCAEHDVESTRKTYNVRDGQLEQSINRIVDTRHDAQNDLSVAVV